MRKSGIRYGCWAFSHRIWLLRMQKQYLTDPCSQLQHSSTLLTGLINYILRGIPRRYHFKNQQCNVWFTLLNLFEVGWLGGFCSVFLVWFAVVSVNENMSTVSHQREYKGGTCPCNQLVVSKDIHYINVEKRWKIKKLYILPQKKSKILMERRGEFESGNNITVLLNANSSF